MDKEAELEMAERYVREGEIHIAEQRGRIERLRRDGHDTTEADAFLVALLETQASHLSGLDLIRRELAGDLKL